MHILFVYVFLLHGTFFICPFLYRREECHRLSDHLLLVMSLLRIHVTSYFRVGVCIEVVVSCVVGLPLP